jgi:hypothetical protein
VFERELDHLDDQRLVDHDQHARRTAGGDIRFRHANIPVPSLRRGAPEQACELASRCSILAVVVTLAGGGLRMGAVTLFVCVPGVSGCHWLVVMDWGVGFVLANFWHARRQRWC